MIKKRDCVEVPQGGLQSRSAYHREYGLRVGSWNFSGLCSQRKQKEVSEVLNKLKLDIVAVQESWERKGSVIEVQGYGMGHIKVPVFCKLKNAILPLHETQVIKIGTVRLNGK